MRADARELGVGDLGGDPERVVAALNGDVEARFRRSCRRASPSPVFGRATPSTRHRALAGSSVEMVSARSGAGERRPRLRCPPLDYRRRRARRARLAPPPLANRLLPASPSSRPPNEPSSHRSRRRRRHRRAGPGGSAKAGRTNEAAASSGRYATFAMLESASAARSPQRLGVRLDIGPRSLPDDADPLKHLQHLDHRDDRSREREQHEPLVRPERVGLEDRRAATERATATRWIAALTTTPRRARCGRNGRIAKIEAVGERQLSAWKSGESARSENAIARAYSKRCDARLDVPGPAVTSDREPAHQHADRRAMPRYSRAPSRPLVALRGGSIICVGSGGSMPSASAGRPFVTRLIQRIMSGRSPGIFGHHARDEHGDEQARVRREQEEDELLDVAPDRAAFADGVDDGREVVVGEHHVRGLARDVGAVLAHRDADVRFASAGASFTPSPVIATMWPRALNAFTMRSFCSAVTRANTRT